MYLAFLSGPRTVREAANVSGLHRATAYRVILRLIDRGLVLSKGGSPRDFQAIDPSALFHRLELFYRDETEIPGLFAEAFERRNEVRSGGLFPAGGGSDPPRVLAWEARSAHPAILELTQAKRSVGGLVRPLSIPAGYRISLARTLGHLAGNGVHVRLLTDAMPSDLRFGRAVLREAGRNSGYVQIRHYCPVVSQLYSIDRQTVIRLSTLGASNRAPPVAVAVSDRARVQALVTRFESLWSDAGGSTGNLGSGSQTVRSSDLYQARRTATS